VDGIGIALFVAVLLVVREHQGLARFTYTAGLAGVALLVLPALLLARFSEVNGAKLWIRFAGLSFQPAELGKVALIVSFAGYLAAKRQTLMVLSTRVLGFPLPRARDVGPLLVVWAVARLVLYAEHDLGTALLFFGIFLAMLYVDRPGVLGTDPGAGESTPLERAPVQRDGRLTRWVDRPGTPSWHSKPLPLALWPALTLPCASLPATVHEQGCAAAPPVPGRRADLCNRRGVLTAAFGHLEVSTGSRRPCV